jgi:hypothetical protein
MWLACQLLNVCPEMIDTQHQTLPGAVPSIGIDHNVALTLTLTPANWKFV